MSRTDTDIANMAADFLDVDPIGKLATDYSGIGKAFRRNYGEAVKTVLAEFTWNCATTKTGLTAIDPPAGWATDPTDFQYVFALPHDFVRAVDINGRPVKEVNHAIEHVANTDGNGVVTSRQKVLMCDEQTGVTLRYVALIGAADMDSHLAKAVALELAIRCVMKAANSTAKMTKLELLYRDATKGTVARTGGHQISSRENNAKPPVAYLGTGGRARAGII